MLSNATDAWNHLRSVVNFRTYSDSRLASLYLDNPDGFPVHLLLKVFDVVLDPLFKTEDITFKSLWDVFDHISESRGHATVVSASGEIAPISSSEDRTCPVPPIVVSLIIDRMVEDRLPLRALAEKEDWRDAYKASAEDLYAMSLVHSSWAPIARRALQRRAVVPHHRIDRFLLSPLCGPWIGEMVVYWTIDNGLEGATRSHVDLFGALLKRTPGLRSLAFNTSLVWPSYEWEEHDAPPFRVEECLELTSVFLPNLENLWLQHIRGEIRTGSVVVPSNAGTGYRTQQVHLTKSLKRCDDTRALFRHLHRLRSLKLLSMHLWSGFDPADIGQHPCLGTVEFSKLGFKSTYRPASPKGPFNLFAVSCVSSDLKRIPPSALYSLNALRVQNFDSISNVEAMQSCRSLARLEFTVRYFSVPPPGTLPPSLEYLKIENSDGEMVLCSIFLLYPYEPSKSQAFCDFIRSLPRLHCLVFLDTRLSRNKAVVDRLRQLVSTLPSEREDHMTPSFQLIEYCKGHGIQFVVEGADSPIVIC